jgi:hypothetical protein
MTRLMGLIVLLSTFGCRFIDWDLGPWGGPAYRLDSEKIGTGQQAITPRTDASHWNGEAMNVRRR